MTTLELEAGKAHLVREILTKVDNMELLEKLSAYLHKNLSQTNIAPCQYTIKELNSRLDASTDNYQNGNYCTSDDMRKKH